MSDLFERRLKTSEDIRAGLVAEIHRQHAEIERLRAALEEIIDKQCGGGAYAIAREALKDKPSALKDKAHVGPHDDCGDPGCCPDNPAADH